LDVLALQMEGAISQGMLTTSEAGKSKKVNPSF
jgi:hypothetical protein